MPYFFTRHAALTPLCLGLLLSCGAALAQQSRCNEEDPKVNRPARDVGLLETSGVDPRTQLQELVQLAQTRSRAIGAVRLLTLAAEADLAEAKAQRLPTVGLSNSVGYVGSNVPGGSSTR